MSAMVLLLAAVVGYLVGAVSPATLVTARRGIDLRDVGSGNPGASNVGRALGRKTGMAVAALDVLKGLVPAAAFEVIDHRAGLIAGLAAVLGHVTSPFLRGKGGKGVATAAGAVIGSQPLWAPVVLLVWFVVLAASRWIALASVTAALSLPVLAIVLGQDVRWALGLAAVIVVRHRPNLVRRLSLRRTGKA